MRKSTLYVCSTAHLPVAERNAIDRLIEGARREPVGGRLVVDHDILAIEPHQFGFFVATAALDDHHARPEVVSVALWRILTIGFAAGAAWILFDRDEPAHPSLPIY